MDDQYIFEVETDVDSIYGGASDGCAGFRRFLHRMEKKRGLLPSWWSPEKAAECVKFGMRDCWSSLASAVGKSDIIEHYGNSIMLMQLRMLGEQIYGTGPGGQNGTAMMHTMMMSEAGRFAASTLLEMSSLFSR
ncbi:uncharacterized protein BJX67DRAFT_381595 [Aspergillus lucknowensis]|uniref:Uncharacterized protein n=1 Tax=Aspergillus lucknowensis TaxID=176173 RepID=A0ABR4LQ62_9EURO